MSYSHIIRSVTHWNELSHFSNTFDVKQKSLFPPRCQVCVSLSPSSASLFAQIYLIENSGEIHQNRWKWISRTLLSFLRLATIILFKTNNTLDQTTLHPQLNPNPNKQSSPKRKGEKKSCVHALYSFSVHFKGPLYQKSATQNDMGSSRRMTTVSRICSLKPGK